MLKYKIKTFFPYQGTFRLYEVEDAPPKPLLGVHQGSAPQPITVRVYAVMATNLTARDIGEHCVCRHGYQPYRQGHW